MLYYGVMAIVLLVIGLILFVGLVIVHEFGHFIAARRSTTGIRGARSGDGYAASRLWPDG